MVPRSANSSMPRSRASRAPISGRLSVMTMILAPASGDVGGGEAVHHRDRQDAVLALERLDAIDDSRASAGGWSAASRASGSRTPRHAGSISLRAMRSARSTTSSARSAKSVCGTSLNMTRMSRASSRCCVRCECGSNSAAMTASGPTIVADPPDEVAFAIVVAVGDHRAVQAEDDDIERQRRARPVRGSRRAASRRRRG